MGNAAKEWPRLLDNLVSGEVGDKVIYLSPIPLSGAHSLPGAAIGTIPECNTVPGAGLLHHRVVEPEAVGRGQNVPVGYQASAAERVSIDA